MGRHRLEQPARVRPRFGRMAAAVLSLSVTLVALLGGIGVLPLQTARGGSEQLRTAADIEHPAKAAATPVTPDTGAGQAPRGSRPADVSVPASLGSTGTTLPSASGQGRRVVFSTSAQRVWLVEADGTVDATYLVSGSLTDNLHAGTYAVYSRSRWAVGVDDSGVMQYFVRFAHGRHAAIGFHSIPTKRGRPLQTEAQLGTPQSHGCIRQRFSDAQRMWEFAGVGTRVVVLA
ncbi:MAG TPA: L,D-transpeptidase [Marmoricola sp.]|nr:L,D-transpeptidase [Marmoricola sp.]